MDSTAILQQAQQILAQTASRFRAEALALTFLHQALQHLYLIKIAFPWPNGQGNSQSFIKSGQDILQGAGRNKNQFLETFITLLATSSR